MPTYKPEMPTTPATITGGKAWPPQPASPTGIPVLPPAAVPYVAALVALLALVSESDLLPEGHWAGKVLRLLVALGGLLGVVSPGLRRR